jgi:hypothetical protein
VGGPAAKLRSIRSSITYAIPTEFMLMGRSRFADTGRSLHISMRRAKSLLEIGNIFSQAANSRLEGTEKLR